MTDNEYYYYMERNKGRLDLDRADLGVGQGQHTSCARHGPIA